MTPDEIKVKLENNQAWLERGILAIYAKQTEYEKNIQGTAEFNRVGFNGPDGHYLSYIAKWLQDGKHLSGKHLDKAREKMLKYSGQLAKITNHEI